MAETFDISFNDLPESLPIFPLPRVILLPRVQLPLNVFEPRYLAMTRSSLGSHRLIGIIQPEQKTGCAGRIISFSETEDGRYLITLKGICRFDVARELPGDTSGFRNVGPDWAPYKDDFAPDTSTDICRETMMQSLRGYFDKMGLFCDQWEQMRDISCDKLISTLSVVCPFDAADKQALLEAKTLAERAEILRAAVEISACRPKEEKETTCH